MLYKNAEELDLVHDFKLFNKESVVEFTEPASEEATKVSAKIFDDYIRFFTTEEGADMLPYVYMESCQLYEDLVNYKDYYLFNDEVSLIQSNKKELSYYLSDVSNIVEIGPGSCHTIRHKTLPIIDCAQNLKVYHAIDYSENYLKGACDFIKSNTANIDISSTKADLMQSIPLELSLQLQGKRAVMLLGSTIENFTLAEQKHILEQVEHLTPSGSIFILSVDTNQDESLLLAAYDNECMHKFTEACLKYFTRIAPNFQKYISLFETKCAWNEKLKYIDMYFKAKESFSFDVNKYGMINITEGQEFRALKSRKPDKQQVIDLLDQHSFNTIDVLMNSNKMLMFICEKR